MGLSGPIIDRGLELIERENIGGNQRTSVAFSRKVKYFGEMIPRVRVHGMIFSPKPIWIKIIEPPRAQRQKGMLFFNMMK